MQSTFFKFNFTQLKYCLISIRPYQWSKNFLVFAALIYSGHLFVALDLIFSVVTFFLFSFVSGWVYILNDIKDKEEDKLHPIKKNRPIASGKISPFLAFIFSTVLLIVSFVIASIISINLVFVLALYCCINFFYSLYLKHVVILDILLVAIGFVLRAIAGAVAINVLISPWLLICTFFLALFLVIGKRRNELIEMKENAGFHRAALLDYSPHILDQMTSVVTGTTILAYALYTLDVQTVEKFGTQNLIYTVPLVVYGIFRYFYLIYKQNLGGAPEKLLFRDKHILINVLLWVIVVSFIIYFK